MRIISLFYKNMPQGCRYCDLIVAKCPYIYYSPTRGTSATTHTYVHIHEHTIRIVSVANWTQFVRKSVADHPKIMYTNGFMLRNDGVHMKGVVDLSGQRW